MGLEATSDFERFLLLGASSCAISCGAPGYVKDLYHASAGVVHWSVTDLATNATATEGCAVDRRNSNPNYYAERIRFPASPGTSLTETVTWEMVTKDDDPAPPLDDDSYWCTDAGRFSTREPLGKPNQACVETADADPPTTIQNLSLVDATGSWARGRTLRLVVSHAGVLALRYRAGCFDVGDAQSAASAPWSELAILP